MDSGGESGSEADRAHRRIVLVLLAVFLPLVAAGIHGYSLPWYHHYLDGSPAPEVLAGAARGIRSDDWGSELPMLLAQVAHAPSMPLRNTLIGDGTDVLVFSKLPVAHPLVLFRPTSWGFFLGRRTGLAWLWWSLWLGCFYAVFLVALRLSRGRAGLSVAAGLLVAFSPYAQLWSFDQFQIPIFAALGVAAFHALLTATRRRGILAAAALLAWTLGCLATHLLYPAKQVTCGWLLAALMVALAAERVREAGRPTHLGYRVLGLLGAVAVAAGALGWLVLVSRDGVQALMGSSYPGSRFCTGGDLPAWRWAADSLYLFHAARGGARWTFGANECEAAGFVFLFVPVLGALAWRWGVEGEGPDPVTAALAGVNLVLAAYSWLGVPAWLSRATLLFYVHGTRAWAAQGLASHWLLVRYLSTGRAVGRAGAAASAGAWTVLLLLAAGPLGALTPEVAGGTYLVAALVQGALAYLLLTRRAVLPVLGLLVGLSVLATARVNPVVRGGTPYLRTNPVSRAMLEADRVAGGGTRWAVFGPWPMANLCRILGLGGLLGTLPHPVPAFWHRIDPQEAQRDAWNRYGHFELRLAARPDAPPVLSLLQGDWVGVELAPETGILDRLGVTHVLGPSDQAARFQAAGFEPGALAGSYRIYVRGGGRRAP